MVCADHVFFRNGPWSPHKCGRSKLSGQSLRKCPFQKLLRCSFFMYRPRTEAERLWVHRDKNQNCSNWRQERLPLIPSFGSWSRCSQSYWEATIKGATDDGLSKAMLCKRSFNSNCQWLFTLSFSVNFTAKQFLASAETPGSQVKFSTAGRFFSYRFPVCGKKLHDNFQPNSTRIIIPTSWGLEQDGITWNWHELTVAHLNSATCLVILVAIFSRYFPYKLKTANQHFPNTAVFLCG